MLLVVSICLSLVLAELLVRWVAPQINVTPLSEDLNGLDVPKANVQGRQMIPRTFEVSFTSSSQRFRGRREFTVFPRPGITRIAVLGDSYTWGFGANDDETYPARLQQLLGERTRLPFEVINAGIQGIGAGEEALYYVAHVRTFHPAIVVLTLNSSDSINDLERELFLLNRDGTVSPRQNLAGTRKHRVFQLVRGAANAFPGYTFLAEHSQLITLLRVATSTVLRQGLSKGVAADMPGRNPELLPRVETQALPVLAGEISWLNERVKSDGARLVVVWFPAQDAVYLTNGPGDQEDRTIADKMLAVLRRTCAHEGIPFADFTEAMQERARSERSRLYYEGSDSHPNPLGYGAFAKLVCGLLVSEKILTVPMPSSKVPSSEERIKPAEHAGLHEK